LKLSDVLRENEMCAGGTAWNKTISAQLAKMFLRTGEQIC